MVKVTSIYILIVLLAGICLAYVFGLGAYRYLYAQDFWMYAHVPCDPVSEGCFLTFADEAANPFKVIYVKAYAAPNCDGLKGECPVLSCETLPTADCEVFYCSQEIINNLGLDAQCSGS